MRPLLSILQDSVQTLPAHESQCCQAIEAELLIHGVFYGFPLLPVGVSPEDVPPFDVDNYPSSELSVAAITATIGKELEGGLLQVVEAKPHWLTPLYGKEELTRTERWIKFASSLIARSHWGAQSMMQWMSLRSQCSLTKMRPPC